MNPVAPRADFDHILRENSGARRRFASRILTTLDASNPAASKSAKSAREWSTNPGQRRVRRLGPPAAGRAPRLSRFGRHLRSFIRQLSIIESSFSPYRYSDSALGSGDVTNTRNITAPFGGPFGGHGGTQLADAAPGRVRFRSSSPDKKGTEGVQGRLLTGGCSGSILDSTILLKNPPTTRFYPRWRYRKRGSDCRLRGFFSRIVWVRLPSPTPLTGTPWPAARPPLGRM
jgi:hypothetical protein